MKSPGDIDQFARTGDRLMGGNGNDAVEMGVGTGADRPDHLQMRRAFACGDPADLVPGADTGQHQYEIEKNDAENKAADMGPPGHAAAQPRIRCGIDKLQHEPDTDKEVGWNIYKVGNKKNRDEG